GCCRLGDRPHRCLPTRVSPVRGALISATDHPRIPIPHHRPGGVPRCLVQGTSGVHQRSLSVYVRVAVLRVPLQALRVNLALTRSLPAWRSVLIPSLVGLTVTSIVPAFVMSSTEVLTGD